MERYKGGVLSRARGADRPKREPKRGRRRRLAGLQRTRWHEEGLMERTKVGVISKAGGADRPEWQPKRWRSA